MFGINGVKSSSVIIGYNRGSKKFSDKLLGTNALLMIL